MSIEFFFIIICTIVFIIACVILYFAGVKLIPKDDIASYLAISIMTLIVFACIVGIKVELFIQNSLPAETVKMEYVDVPESITGLSSVYITTSDGERVKCDVILDAGSDTTYYALEKKTFCGCYSMQNVLHVGIAKEDLDDLNYYTNY